MAEIQSMKQLVKSLQRQNQAKDTQRQTLYRQMGNLTNQLTQMQKYYNQKKELTKQIKCLRQEFCSKASQCDQLLDQISASTQLFNHKIHMLQEEINKKCNDLRFAEEKLALLELNKSQKLFQNNDTIKYLQAEKNKVAFLEQQNLKLSHKISQSYCEIKRLQLKLSQFENKDLVEMQKMERNIQQIVQNYETIQKVVVEKEHKISQMYDYIVELEDQCQKMNSLLIEREQYINQLERQIITLKQKNRFSRTSSRELDKPNSEIIMNSIKKIDLIRQNNRMIQQINQMEQQNNPYMNNRCDSERYANSETNLRDNYSLSSPKKLQIRIQTLKMENENLLKNLAI